jgi:hypothetical protein
MPGGGVGGIDLGEADKTKGMKMRRNNQWGCRRECLPSGSVMDSEKADVGDQVFSGFDGKVFFYIFKINPLVMTVPAIEGDDGIAIDVHCPI